MRLYERVVSLSKRFVPEAWARSATSADDSPGKRSAKDFAAVCCVTAIAGAPGRDGAQPRPCIRAASISC
jgi:hypothetical protein